MRAFFFTLMLLGVGLYADPLIPETPFEKKIDLEPQEDELVAIERVIILTEKQQEAQKKLKNLIVEMRENKELFMKGDQSKLHAYYMITSAKEILKIIQNYHLSHLFSSDFMDELALFTQIGKKENPSL